MCCRALPAWRIGVVDRIGDKKAPAKPYGSAAVSSYKQSVMMNSLFRTIKENRNLDLLEESDDEDSDEEESDDSDESSSYIDLGAD